jgi:4'-phosphopantetheinyl transferase
MAAMRVADDRRRFVAARSLLREVVADHARVRPDDIVIDQRCDRCGGPHGRPTVRVAGRPGPPVSLAHADEAVVVAVSATDRLIGVDVEPLGRLDRWAGLAPVALSDGERADLDRLPATERPLAVLRTWVRKEALLKAVGCGLDLDPRLVEQTPSAPIGVATGAGPGPSPVAAISDLPGPDGFVAAVATLG